MKTHTKAYLGLLALLWCFGIIVLYYVSHKPLTPDLALAIGRIVWNLIVAFAIVSLAGGIGYRLFQGFKRNTLVQWTIQAGLGFGILSLGILVLGGIIGYLRYFLWAGLPVLVVLFFRSIIAWWRQTSGIQELRPVGRKSVIWFILPVGGLLASTLIIALAPPVKFDSLVYHLLLPNAYLQAGRVLYLPWIVMTGMPQNAEMLYILAIAWGGNSAATTLAWTFGAITMIGLLGYLKEKVDGPAAWVGAGSLLAGYTTCMVLGWGYVDWLVMLNGLAVLICLDEWRLTGENRFLIWAGIFTGLAIGTKYTSVVLAISGLAVLGWHSWRRKTSFLPAVLRFGLPASLVALPWFLKNLITTGNPLYPFLFPAGAVTPLRISVYQNLTPWGNWWDLFLLPIRATYFGQDGADGYMAAIGPLLLGLGAVFWWGWNKRSPSERATLENAAALAIATWLVWGIGNRFSGNLIQTRYYFSIFPALVVLAAVGFDNIRKMQIPGIRLERIINALVILILGLNLIEVGKQVLQQGSLQMLVGLKTQEDYLADNLGWYQPAMKAIRDLPADKRVLLIFEPRSLYCTPRCLPDEILDHWKRDRAELISSDAVRRRWRDENFTHVLFNKSGAEFLVEAGDPHHSSEDLTALKEFLATLPQPVDFGGVYQLYSIE